MQKARGTSRKKKSAKIVLEQEKAAREAKSKGLGERSCKDGFILRRAHYREAPGGRKTLVPAACVRDPLAGKREPGELGRWNRPRGLRDGKGDRVVVRVEPGRLERHGYSADSGERRRRTALRAAVAFEGEASWLSLFRRLVLLSTWNKRSNPERAERVRADAEYLKKKYGQAIKTKGR